MTLRLNGDSSGFTEIKAADAAGDNSIKLPASNGGANQLLQNGGTAGELQYTSAGGGLHYDSSGRLLAGTSTAPWNNTDALIQTTSSFGSNIVIGRENQPTIAGQAIGATRFYSYNGSAYQESASIVCTSDDTHAVNDVPGRLEFSVTPDGDNSPDEVMRITSDKYVRLASGTGGIQFGGDTAAANALDDYEEGTFLPAYSAAGCSFSYGFRYGFYTKIGRQVSFWLWIRGQSSGSIGSQLNISGLPFSSSNTNGNYSAVSIGQIYFVDYPTSSNFLNFFIGPNSASISMEYSQDDTTTLALTAGAVDGTTEAGFILSGTYFV